MISEEKKDQIGSMLFDGSMSARAIAEEMSVDVTSVYKIARDLGISLSGKQTSIYDHLTEEQIDQLFKDYDRGVTVATLAEQYHISHQAFYHALRRIGKTVRTKTAEYLEANKFRLDVAVEMYQDGWVLWFIDDETGIDPVAMAKELHKRGIALRGRGVKGRIPARLPDGRFILKGTKDHDLWIERQKRLNAGRVGEYVDQEEATQIRDLFIEAYAKVKHAVPPNFGAQETT